MKKRSLLKTMLLLCALVAGSGSVWADVEVLNENFESQTGLPTDWTSDPKGGGSTSGASAIYSGSDAHGEGSGKAQGKAWKLGTNSNPYGSVTTCALTTLSGNATLTFWARGKSGKSPVIEISGTDCTITGDGTSTTTSGSVATGTIAGSDYTQYTVNISGGSATSTITFRHAGPSNAGSYIYIDDIVISMPTEKTDPTITFNNGSVRVGKTLDLSTLFTSNSSGAVTYSITAGGSYASLDGSTLTGVAEGSVTVQASQAATGAYNAKTTTATITVNAALALSSIAITTAPTKTTYFEDETFDATGMVVTATYSDASTEDVTALCTWTPSGSLTTSDAEITVSYTENAVTKTAKQAITVNVYVQPTSVTATFNNAFLGTAEGSRITEKTTKIQDRVSFIFDKISGSNWPQGDAGVIRMYSGTTLQIVAPLGYVISNITFTANGDWKSGMTADKGTYNDTKDAEDKTYWTGSASSVTFSPEGTHRIASVDVTLSNQSTISLASACTDGEKYYGTYSNGTAFVVPSGLTVSALKVDNDGKLVVMDYAEGDVVKANTGVMVSAATAGDKTITLSAETGTEKAGNLLKPSGDAGITAANMTEADTKFYRLTMHNGTTIGFYWGAADGAAFDLAANKAYLAVPTGATAPSFFWFGGETTGINMMNGAGLKVNGEYFNLNGQRVAQPSKGLYIVNGRKVVVK